MRGSSDGDVRNHQSPHRRQRDGRGRRDETTTVWRPPAVDGEAAPLDDGAEIHHAGFYVLSMLLPSVHVVAVSLSSYEDVLAGGLVLFPSNPTMAAYEAIFRGGIVVRALQVSVGL